MTENAYMVLNELFDGDESKMGISCTIAEFFTNIRHLLMLYVATHVEKSHEVNRHIPIWNEIKNDMKPTKIEGMRPKDYVPEGVVIPPPAPTGEFTKELYDKLQEDPGIKAIKKEWAAQKEKQIKAQGAFSSR